MEHESKLNVTCRQREKYNAECVENETKCVKYQVDSLEINENKNETEHIKNEKARMKNGTDYFNKSGNIEFFQGS